MAERDYVTARLYTGKRHILLSEHQRSLCGADGCWQGRRRPILETRPNLICKKCMRLLAIEVLANPEISQELLDWIAAGAERQ